MNVEEIADFSALAAYADDWRRIAGASERATVFQTWEWTKAWWAHFGAPGKRRLWAMAFRDNGAIVGFAALFLPPVGVPLRVARLVGDGGSDYLDLVALSGYEARVVEAFWACLHDRRRRWDWCDLAQTRPGSVLDSALQSGTRTAGGGVRVTPVTGETCPFLRLPEANGWDGFRKTLGKKMRSNVGYYERNLQKLYEVEYRVASRDTLADDQNAFYDLHQARWNKRWLPGAFATRRARAFHDDAARALLASGHLRLHTLSLDGEIEATLYCFHKAPRTYYYLGGFAPELAKFSIGTVLTAQAIRYAIEADQAAEFDFLRGDEPYKYKWGAQDRRNRRLSVTRRGVVRPLFLSTSGRVSLAVERRLKTWMHNKHGGGAAQPAAPHKADEATQNG